MRTTILTVLTTVALVLVTVGPTAALQRASHLSTGYLTIGGVISTADIGPRRQQDRGFDVVALAFNIQKQWRDPMDQIEGMVETTLIPISGHQTRLQCFTSADTFFDRAMQDLVECKLCLERHGGDHPADKINASRCRGQIVVSCMRWEPDHWRVPNDPFWSGKSRFGRIRDKDRKICDEKYPCSGQFQDLCEDTYEDLMTR